VPDQSLTDLVDRWNQGDEAALVEIYDRWGERIIRAVYQNSRVARGGSIYGSSDMRQTVLKWMLLYARSRRIYATRPEHVEALLGHPRMTYSQFEGMLRMLEKHHEDTVKKEGRFSSYRIEIVKDGAPFETSKDSRLVNRLRRSCEEAGVAPRTEGTAWFSDAGPLAQVCDEIVVFGPGSIKQAHTADEYIELEQLRKGAEVLQAFFNRLSASRSGR